MGYKHSSLVRGLSHSPEDIPISSHPKHWISETLQKYRRESLFTANAFIKPLFMKVNESYFPVPIFNPMGILKQKINVMFILIYKASFPSLNLITYMHA